MKLSHVFTLAFISLLVGCSSGANTAGTSDDGLNGIADGNESTVGGNVSDSGIGPSDDVSGIDGSGKDAGGIDGSGKDGTGIDGSGVIACGDGCSPVLAAGPIDGFGSIIVEGVKYEVPDATQIQACAGGEAIGEDDLSLGMYVEYAGFRNQDGVSGAVSQINACPILCGTVEAVQLTDQDNGANGTEKLITLLGKTVLVNSEDTVFEGRTFESLIQGDQICAFGYGLAGELIFATRVEQQQPEEQQQEQEEVRFDAIIEEILDGSGQLRMSNGLFVAIDANTQTSFTNWAAAVGLRVKVTGVLNGTLVTATSVREDVSPVSLQLEPEQTVIIEGAIDLNTEENRLSVEGVVVALPNDATQTPTFFNLETGLQLLIEAQNTEAGMAARSIYIKRIKEEGTITTIDEANRRVTVELLRFGQNLEFSLDDNTQLLSAANEALTLSQLNTGDEVDVSLSLNEAKQYTAQKVARINAFTGTSSVDPVAVTLTPIRTIDGTVETGEPLTSQTVVINSGATLNLIVNSTEQYGRLIAIDAMTLAGTLQVTLNFTPAAGNSFSLLSWGSLTNGSTFEDIRLLLLPAGLAWDLSNLYSSGEIGVVQAPGGITVSAAFWVDASDPGINYVDGSEVYRWIDKSGNNRNLDAPVATRRPVYAATSTNNGQPGILFTDDSLSDRNNDAFWSNLGDYTIILVSKQTVASSADVLTTGTYFYTRAGVNPFFGLTTQTDTVVGESLTLDSVGTGYNQACISTALGGGLGNGYAVA